MSGRAQVQVDAAHGGRIASLRDATGVERLWSRPDPRRAHVSPGDGFVDVGGVEECFPTLAGNPDHGDVWSRPWMSTDDVLVCDLGDARLERRLRTDDEGLEATYELLANPGYRFIWAFHALLDHAPGLIVDLPGACRVLSWPDGYGAAAREDFWPRVGRHARFDIAGADDGTSAFALIPGQRTASVESSAGTLRVTLDAPGQPTAMGIWRNLAGWPDGTPYRSWGIEPMIGWHPERDRAGAHGGVVASGRLTWTLRVDLPLRV